MLTPLQQQSLREELGIDIYDRYMLVLLIFKQHARTKEAKLQTSLAEMAYFNQRLRRSRSEEIKVLLGQRDVHLRRILGELQSHRQLIRKRRQKLQLPVVSVVGYTNAGKTSLIKRFTNSEKLAPRNQLFATLDVTCHEGYLPRLSKVIYVDTVGFISDIPTQLIASFRATLEDALVADQLAHVFDLSNPDFERQCETVLETLETIQTPTTLRDTLLHVANKVDRVEDVDKLITRAERVLGASALIASCKTGGGISNVLGRLEEGLITNTGRRMVKVRCPNGGDAYAEILRQSSSVENVSVDDLHPNDAILEVLMTTATESKLRAKFRLRPDIFFE